jgi:hypothetical protein
VLLRVEAQREQRPTPPAKRHRHVDGVGALGHGEAGATAPLGRIYEHAAATIRHQRLTIANGRERPPASRFTTTEWGAGAPGAQGQIIFTDWSNQIHVANTQCGRQLIKGEGRIIKPLRDWDEETTGKNRPPKGKP